MAAENRIVRVRIRGIYATALTQLALERGFQVVQASRIIADRFGIPQLGLPADVTLKNNDGNPSELLVVGYRWAASRVLEVLREELPYSFYWVGEPPLHATVKATVVGSMDGECRARLGDIEAVVVGEPIECRPGATIVAGVVKPAVKLGERARLAPGARVIGDYAIVSYTPGGYKGRVTISEHVRNAEKRAELMSLASDYVSKGYTVHWRSSSRFADHATLSAELKQLVKKLQEVLSKAEKGGEGIYSEGETVAIVRLSRPDKERLDELREKTTPTAPWHHSVKSVAPELSAVIDYAEKLVARNVPKNVLLAGLLEYLIDQINQNKVIEIVHVKTDGKELRLGPAHVKNAYLEDNRITLIVERRVRGRGVYDGLGVEKEPGDVIVTEIDTDSWLTVHKYYSRDGVYKGSYININTPPEMAPGKIIYLDLEADIVKLPTGELRVIDLDELLEAHRKGIVTDKLVKKVKEIIKTYTG